MVLQNILEKKIQKVIAFQTNKSLISVIISWLLGWQVLPDQLAAVIWSLWKPALPNIRILFAGTPNVFSPSGITEAICPTRYVTPALTILNY